MPVTPKKDIHELVAEVVLLVEPFSKDGTNDYQNFKFVKVEQVINFARPLLAARGILVIPSGIPQITYEHFDRGDGKSEGTAVWILQEWTFTNGHSAFIAFAVGEANDTGDKAFNKAQTASWKQVMTKVLQIVADDDNDAQHVERGQRYTPQQSSAPGPTKPANNTAWGICPAHKVEFFQSQKMSSPAHKMATGPWCNWDDVIKEYRDGTSELLSQRFGDDKAAAQEWLSGTDLPLSLEATNDWLASDWDTVGMMLAGDMIDENGPPLDDAQAAAEDYAAANGNSLLRAAVAMGATLRPPDGPPPVTGEPEQEAEELPW